MPPALSAADFFAAKLAYETDPADLAAKRVGYPADRDRHPVGRVVESGRIPGAVHIPNTELAARIGEVARDEDAAIVVYCWGPGCNGSTRGALILATLGYTNVRELIGGFEYWTREGLATVSDSVAHVAHPIR